MIDLRRREGRPLRIGHRGTAALASENTIGSLALALELGCDLVEFDVVDLDGSLLLAHSRAEIFGVGSQGGSDAGAVAVAVDQQAREFL